MSIAMRIKEIRKEKKLTADCLRKLEGEDISADRRHLCKVQNGR